MKRFSVADLTPAGDVQLQEEYQYERLEQLPGAVDLIAEFSAFLWGSPEEFEAPFPDRPHMTLRWRATSDSTGIATLRWRDQLCSVSLLVAGIRPEADALTLGALQSRMVGELHDTGVEPAFSLLHLKERPLVASVHLMAPPDAPDRGVFALSDRCFGASYFRKLGLA